jgi:hypothetical protein
MIRKYVQEQLQNCSFADLSGLKPGVYSVLVPKYSKPRYDIGKTYLISVSQEVLNNPNSVTAVNWNSGGFPKSKYLKACVSKTMGKMVYFDCLEYDYDRQADTANMWSGWLSMDEITQISTISQQ